MILPDLQSRFFILIKIFLPDQRFLIFGIKFSKGGHNKSGRTIISYTKGWILTMLDRLSLILTIIGALNWGAIGLFQFDLVAWIFGGQDAILSRIVYTVVALAGIWCISLLFRERDAEDTVGEIR